jgi:uncharacterized protein YunC (DUF1805 family)
MSGTLEGSGNGLKIRRVAMEFEGKVAEGFGYRWPGGQYCAIHTERGVVGCGIFDTRIAGKFSMAFAIARGTPQHPLAEPEDLLGATIVEASEKALEYGVKLGMSGREALEVLLRVGSKQ